MIYFNSSNIKLHHGDSLIILDEMEENSVDMIFADPPYNLSNNGITCQSGKMVSVNKAKWDKSKGIEADFDFHKTWLSKCRRVLKTNGTIWISGTYHSIYACGFAMQQIGFHLLNDISWFKPNAPPNLSCRFFTASHETLLWARKNSKSTHTFNYQIMKNISSTEDFIKSPGKQMRSVWAFTSPKPDEKKFGKHPTQKPMRLLERIILSSTNENDIILDPFNGSGTTGLAALKHNRQYIGIDFEKKYLSLTKKRIIQFNQIKESGLF